MSIRVGVNGLGESTTYITSLSEKFMTSIFNDKLTLLTFRDTNLDTATIDRLLYECDKYFQNNIPTRNIKLSLTGINMGTPVGGLNNTNRLNIINRFNQFNLVAEILVNP